MTYKISSNTRSSSKKEIQKLEQKLEESENSNSILKIEKIELVNENADLKQQNADLKQQLAQVTSELDQLKIDMKPGNSIYFKVLLKRNL